MTLCRPTRVIEVRTSIRRQINGSMYLISMRRVAMASVGEAVIKQLCAGFGGDSRGLKGHIPVVADQVQQSKGRLVGLHRALIRVRSGATSRLPKLLPRVARQPGQFGR